MDFLRRRILISVIAFVVVINIIFILPRLVPGSAAEIFASGTKVPATAVVLITRRLGLDQPLATQYADYLKGIFATWPPYFGFSFEFYPEPVSTLIASRLPWTMFLLVSSFFLSFWLSYFLAGVSSMRRGGKFELGSLYSSIFFWSIPAFWIGIVLIWVFGVSLHWLPVYGNIGFNPGSGVNYVYSLVTHAALPIATLTLVIFGQSYMLLRGAAQDVLKSDYVIAAKSRGLSDNSISNGYILRNSLLPLISLLGYSIASIISAEILVEAVFSYGGVGDLIVDAIINRDYPVLEGSFFYITLLVIGLALLGDFLLVKLDPRLR